MKNKRYRITCSVCGAPLVDNESYDFRVHMYKSEGAGIWCFIDENVDTSGMDCASQMMFDEPERHGLDYLAVIQEVK